MATMTASTQERLLDAMLVEFAETGYEAMAIEDVLMRCGVSAEEFAAEFADKDACMFAAYERLTQQLIDKATQGCESGDAWPEKIRLGLEALVDEFAAKPKIARALMRSFPSIRPAAYLRYVQFLEAFAPFFSEGRKFAEVSDELPAEVEMLAVGAAEAIIFEEIEADRASHLPSMVPAILFSVLVPFLGPDAAAMAMQSAGGPDE
jgi:AcrR family transcriptional regulator